jgi:heat-inducible transcriptional repressor
MEQQITARQSKILTAIIEQYAEVAAPVGSSLLAKLFDVSPATIRAEMVHLEIMGYIAQPHTSAGRIPTDKGYRFYVNNIAEDEIGDKRSARNSRYLQSSISSAGQYQRAVKSAVEGLVKLTDNLGLATIGDTIYMSGLGHLFAQPEFSSEIAIKSVANFLDNLEPWLNEAELNQPLSIYIGTENPIGKASGCSLIISKFNSPFSAKNYIGVLGPTRQSYKNVMQLVSYAGHLLEQKY